MPFSLFQKSKRQQASKASFAYCVPPIRAIEKELAALTDSELALRASLLADSVFSPGPVDDIETLIEASGLMSESIYRVTSLRLHDVQLRGGLVIASGRIAEMQTGEGKTLVAALGAFLQSLTRRGVHVSTTNAYLAERDFERVAPTFELLGVTSGVLREKSRINEAQRAYACDITYGTGYQFGFDYLRDQQLLRERADTPLGTDVSRTIRGFTPATDILRQRGFAMAIVDEADSVLLDEATVPLVLSSRSGEQSSKQAYTLARKLARGLSEGTDYSLGEPDDPIVISEAARERIHQALRGHRVPQLVRPWGKYVENALHAEFRLERDQQYVVQDDEVRIVDQNTGRIFEDRSWRDGLHQAVEAKEGTAIRPDDSSSARITRQRFFQLYDRIAGLTGTAEDGREELLHFYDLPVITIPTNVPGRREVLPSRFFINSDVKLTAAARSAARYFAERRPVLIGTTTIQQSLQIADQLEFDEVPHIVLNGVQDDDEATIVARAGNAGMVTVATNMAGRGTDIKPCEEALQRGGLHVIATEHAISRRIDRQLVGRAARQGDPGSCQFFVSADDEVLTRYAPDLAKRMRTAPSSNGECTNSFEDDIAQLQARLENEHFNIRQDAVRSDAWFDSVREALH